MAIYFDAMIDAIVDKSKIHLSSNEGSNKWFDGQIFTKKYQKIIYKIKISIPVQIGINKLASEVPHISYCLY